MSAQSRLKRRWNSHRYNELSGSIKVHSLYCHRSFSNRYTRPHYILTENWHQLFLLCLHSPVYLVYLYLLYLVYLSLFHLIYLYLLFTITFSTSLPLT